MYCSLIAPNRYIKYSVANISLPIPVRLIEIVT